MTTKTPWRIGPYYKHEIVSDEGVICCAPIDTPVARERMALAVSAVNSHETAKKLAELVIRHGTESLKTRPGLNEIVALARQFKKEAENGPQD